MNFQYEIAQNSVTMSVKKFTELQTFAHKNESDQALINKFVNFTNICSIFLKAALTPKMFLSFFEKKTKTRVF